MSPELNLGTSSLMFYSDQFEQLYNDLINKNATVGDIQYMSAGRVFNFSDNEDNYFAIMDNNN